MSQSMSDNNVKFEMAEHASKVTEYADRLRQIITDADGEEAQDFIKEFDEELGSVAGRGVLNLAFVGQYNAGKSTTISALTERDDLKIDSDIATDKTREFDWNGIKVIDTPGICTERADHDAITMEALRQADLLVYMLTYNLFDTVTLKNFERLAFEEGYRSKMLLLVNKINDEAGDVNARVDNYKQSIDASFAPNNATIGDFDHAFIDARDYIDGKLDNDAELIDESRFGDFVSLLNDFVGKKGAMAQLDTPVRVLLSHAEEAQSRRRRQLEEPDVYPELLKRLRKRVNNQRRQLKNRINIAVEELKSDVAQVGVSVSGYVGSDEDAQSRIDEGQQKISELCESKSEEIKGIADSAVSALQEDVREVYDSDLVAEYFTLAETNLQPYESGAIAVGQSQSGLKREHWDKFSEIAETAGLSIYKMSGGALGGTKITASQASGTPMHGIVKFIGKKIFKINFKSWGICNTTKVIGNFARYVGPTVQGVTLLFDLAAASKEEKEAQALSKAKREVQNGYLEHGQEIKSSFLMDIKKLEEETFDVIEKKIDEAEAEYEKSARIADNSYQQLVALRNELKGFLGSISNTPESSMEAVTA